MRVLLRVVLTLLIAIPLLLALLVYLELEVMRSVTPPDEAADARPSGPSQAGAGSLGDGVGLRRLRVWTR
jgi:hypothetical protein